MRFVFLQPDLRSKTSAHFYHYIWSVKTALAEKGFESITIANEIFEDESSQVHRFSFKNHVNRFSNPAAVLWRIVTHNISSFVEFKKLMSELARVEPGTVFFVDTILNERILALAFAFKKVAKKYPSVKLAVVFRFTYRSNSRLLTGLQKGLHRYFCSSLALLIKGKKCIMFTDSKRLKDSYENNFSGPVQLMPIPLRSGLYEEICLKKCQTKKVKCLGFIGGKVGYKGLDIFIKTIVRLADHDINFLVHGIEGTAELFAYAADFLLAEEMAILQQLTYKITTQFRPGDQEYLLMFDVMDIIMIPYTSLQFAEGTSNIFAESVSAGVMPVVPANTWMADELAVADLQEMIVCTQNIPATAATIAALLTDNSVIQQKMETFSANWRNYHDSRVFAGLLIESLSQ